MHLDVSVASGVAFWCFDLAYSASSWLRILDVMEKSFWVSGCPRLLFLDNRSGNGTNWQHHYVPMLKMRDGMSAIVFGNVAAPKGQIKRTFGRARVDIDVIRVRLGSPASGRDDYSPV